jgi:hypothetical protein
MSTSFGRLRGAAPLPFRKGRAGTPDAHLPGPSDIGCARAQHALQRRVARRRGDLSFAQRLC